MPTFSFSYPLRLLSGSSLAALLFAVLLTAQQVSAQDATPTPAATASTTTPAAAVTAPADPMSPVATPATNDDQIGVCTHFAFKGNNWPTDKMVPLIVKSGAGWIRDDFIWAAIEKAPGVYEIPPETMNWITAVSAAGIKIDITFNYGNKIYPDHYDPDAFAAAAAWTAKTLAGKIQAIEIMNEPENFGFSKYYDHEQAWSGLKKDGEVADYIAKYVNLLNTAAKAIRAANPSIKIIGLGMSPGANFHALALGIGPEVDGITDHPYSTRTAPEFVPFKATPGILKRDGIWTADARGTFSSQIKMYFDLSAKNNGPKEIWLTEQGWPTYREARPNQFAGFTQDQQAKYILRRLLEARGLGVSTTFIYDLRNDGPSPTNNENNFGLLDINSNPKPAGLALQRFAAVMSGFHPKETFNITAAPVPGGPDANPLANALDEPQTENNPIVAPVAPVKTGPAVELPGEVKTYQFVDGKGNPLVALWSTQPMDGKLGPLVTDIDINSARTISKISAYDPYHDTTQDIPFVAKTGGVTLKQFTVPDAPLLLTITSS